MKKIYFLMFILVACSPNPNDRRWIDNINSIAFFDSNGTQLSIDSSGNVTVPTTTGGTHTFYFDSTRSEVEAYYTQSGKKGFMGLKLETGILWQTGYKADSTSGATLSEKKDFVDFSKKVKELGSKR